MMLRLLPAQVDESNACYDSENMPWTTRQFSRSQIDAAGDLLADESRLVHVSVAEFDQAIRILENWRSAHSFPLNTLQNGLRAKAKLVDANRIVAQRLKRYSSIIQKLQRFGGMKLSRMQDLGGCRAIVRSVAHVRRLVAVHKSSNMRHSLDREDDYISGPQKSGYRGVHLVYKYVSDKNDKFNGQKIEVQLRSKLQHQWATAVETVGTFIRQALKSSQGEDDWLRFFSLMGSANAIQEGTSLVPNTPSKKGELTKEIRELAGRLDVARRLQSYGAAIRTLKQPSVAGAYYLLLELRPDLQETRVYGFKIGDLKAADDQYGQIEGAIRSIPGAEAVLVNVESVTSLERAYPNYFLDTTAFVATLNQVLRGQF